MNLPKNRFVSLWLASASILTLLRFLNAADLDYDLTLQMEAAQNLLAGKGLSIYWPTETDLAKPATLLTLTHFPAGYSLCAAGLISIGFSLGAVAKLSGAAGTLLGWWRWGRLADIFFKEGLLRSWTARWSCYIIAIATPLLFTPSWHGTDILLWAAVPWVLHWIVRASDDSVVEKNWHDGLAGVVCGVCVLMRYASMFLVVYAGFLILVQSKAHLKILTRRCAVFTAGLLPPIALQAYFNFYVSNAPANPGGLTFGRSFWAAAHRAQDAFWLLTSANFAVVYWMPGRIIDFLTRPGKQAPWLFGATFIVFVLAPSLAMKLKHQGRSTVARELKIAMIGFFVAVPLFLWVCMILGDYDYVSDFRHYLPVLPIALILAYALAYVEEKQRSNWQRLLQVISLGYLAGYVCLGAVGVTLLLLPHDWGSSRRVKLMGTPDLQHWPSMKVNYEFSPARTYTARLLKEQPDMILVTNRESWFYADPTLDRSRIYRIETPQYFRAGYISGPAHVLIVALEPQEHLGEELHLFTAWAGQPERANYLERLPGLHLLRRFPEENINILEARIPDGKRIALK